MDYPAEIHKLTPRWTTATTVFTVVAVTVGALVGAGQFSVAAIVAFAAAAMAVSLARIGLLVDYYLVLGAFTFPGAFDRVAGMVSLTWLRTTLLAGVYVAIALLLLALRVSSSLLRDERRFLAMILAWIAFLGVSIAWSLSPIDSMRYYPKFVMAAALAAVLIMERRLSAHRGWKLLVLGGVIFVVATYLAMPFKSVLWPDIDYPFAEGFSGRHQSKYYLVFVTILALGTWISNVRRAWPLLLALASTVALVLILQRGAFLALFAGAGLALLACGPRRGSLTVFRIGVGIVVVMTILAVLFFSPAFQSYMFQPNYGPADLFGAMVSGDARAVMEIVYFRGRLEYWGAVLAYSPVSLFGIGFGSTPVLIERFFGQYNELHSDIIQFWVETGIVGYLLYIGIWIVLLRLGWKHRRSTDPLTLALAFTLIGYTVGLMAWSFVDHVMNYAHMGGAFLFAVAALLLVRRRELEANNKASDQVRIPPAA